MIIIIILLILSGSTVELIVFDLQVEHKKQLYYIHCKHSGNSKTVKLFESKDCVGSVFMSLGECSLRQFELKDENNKTKKQKTTCC